MAPTAREVAVGAPPDRASRDEAEDRDARDHRGVAEGHLVRHAPAALVPGDGEAVEAERRRRLDLVAGHRALAVRRAAGAGAGRSEAH
jgi:hypothetical protein